MGLWTMTVKNMDITDFYTPPPDWNPDYATSLHLYLLGNKVRKFISWKYTPKTVL